MGRRRKGQPTRTIKVMVSPALFQEMQKYAEPLVDNFESACWKVIRAAKEGDAK
uniref:Uncharacterized protein n=1 Tax=viral metagenome TaxID=1070528 RepID=A0A6M3X479_9ZZZZ